MERLTTDNPQGNFETILNYVYSKDGIAYIRNDGVNDDVPLHEWARRECIARGCDEFPGETFEEIDEAICDCAFDHGECPIFLAYTFACQACHLRDRLKRYEDAALAMAAGARSIENNKHLVCTSYVLDPFGKDGGPHEISYYDAAQTLRKLSSFIIDAKSPEVE